LNDRVAINGARKLVWRQKTTNFSLGCTFLGEAEHLIAAHFFHFGQAGINSRLGLSSRSLAGQNRPCMKPSDVTTFSDITLLGFVSVELGVFEAADQA
jgi:hypothetical protein